MTTSFSFEYLLPKKWQSQFLDIEDFIVQYWVNLMLMFRVLFKNQWRNGVVYCWNLFLWSLSQSGWPLCFVYWYFGKGWGLYCHCLECIVVQRTEKIDLDNRLLACEFAFLVEKNTVWEGRCIFQKFHCDLNISKKKENKTLGGKRSDLICMSNMCRLFVFSSASVIPMNLCCVICVILCFARDLSCGV